METHSCKQKDLEFIASLLTGIKNDDGSPYFDFDWVCELYKLDNNGRKTLEEMIKH